MNWIPASYSLSLNPSPSILKFPNPLPFTFPAKFPSKIAENSPVRSRIWQPWIDFWTKMLPACCLLIFRLMSSISFQTSCILLTLNWCLCLDLQIILSNLDSYILYTLAERLWYWWNYDHVHECRIFFPGANSCCWFISFWKHHLNKCVSCYFELDAQNPFWYGIKLYVCFLLYIYIAVYIILLWN